MRRIGVTTTFHHTTLIKLLKISPSPYSEDKLHPPYPVPMYKNPSSAHTVITTPTMMVVVQYQIWEFEMETNSKQLIHQAPPASTNRFSILRKAQSFISQGGLRFQIFNAHDNDLASFGAIIRMGRKSA